MCGRGDAVEVDSSVAVYEVVAARTDVVFCNICAFGYAGVYLDVLLSLLRAVAARTGRVQLICWTARAWMS